MQKTKGGKKIHFDFTYRNLHMLVVWKREAAAVAFDFEKN